MTSRPTDTDTTRASTIQALNALPESELRTQLRACCAANSWVEGMIAARPYADLADLHRKAENLWPSLSEADWLEAFDAHPQIGDISSLQEKYADTRATAGHEQAGASVASDDVLQRLKTQNEAYLARFGFIFIVCATGKSATEMLELLEARLPNTRAQEIDNAAREQAKITHLRLEKLL